MNSSDDSPIHELQEEIRRAGRSTRWWRLGAGGVFLLPAGAVLVATIASIGTDPRTRLIPPELSAVLIAFLAAVACGAALLAAAVYRAARRFRIRQRLAALHPQQIAEVLRPLLNERGDTGKIMAPILRQFGIPAGLPSTPEGRGEEPGPTP